MASTYDDTLPSNRDWVRFLIRDTDAPNTVLSDEEIDAVIAEQDSSNAASVKYGAAADCLRVLKSRMASTGGGKLEKETVHLRIKWGVEQGSLLAIDEAIDYYTRKCAWELEPDTAKVLSIIDTV